MRMAYLDSTLRVGMLSAVLITKYQENRLQNQLKILTYKVN
jgi:hypothetical protein